MLLETKERSGSLAVYLLLTATVMFTCVLLYKVSGRLGIPMLLAFILLGMFFGSDGVLKIPFDNFLFSERICSIALIFIMFYGGFGTNWNEAKPVVGKSVLLSSLGVVMTAGFVGLFCRFCLRWDWAESFLLGSVIGSTDAASVFSILRSKRLSLKYNTASLLEVESGSNDPFAYMLTVIVLSVMQGKHSGRTIAYLLFSQLVYGVLFGIVIAVASVWLLRRARLASGFDAVLVTAIAILSYAAPAAVGGNGYLSAYLVGIVLGNARIRNKQSLVSFFDGMTGLMQMLIFFLLGLLSFPSRLPQVVLPSLLIALFLTFVARPLAVTMLLAPVCRRPSQLFVISWAGLRGAASIVFAVMAVMTVHTENDIFHIVFGIVLFSILLQGSLLPLISRKLGMIDEGGDVMKTFTDYSEETPVQFIQFSIPKGHLWCGKTLQEIMLPPDTLLVLLERNGKRLVPNGRTKLLGGDKLILSAKSSDRIEGVNLSEQRITQSSEYCGKCLAEAAKGRDTLVVLILRGDESIIPNGQTVLCANDVLVLHHTE